MDELQQRVATLALRDLAPYGFVLAGGQSLQMHGLIDRPSTDVDLFTDQMDSASFTSALAAAVTGLSNAGYVVEVVRSAQTFARLDVSDPGANLQTTVDMAVDAREFPPAMLPVGPVLDIRDAVANEVVAVLAAATPATTLTSPRSCGHLCTRAKRSFAWRQSSTQASIEPCFVRHSRQSIASGTTSSLSTASTSPRLQRCAARCMTGQPSCELKVAILARERRHLPASWLPNYRPSQARSAMMEGTELRAGLSIDDHTFRVFALAYAVKRMSAFGSVLRSDFGPDSDIDLLVEFESGQVPRLLTISRMEIELEQMIGRTVDLCTYGDLSRYFRDEFRESARQLYAA